MTSDKQIAANRRNARKSTGPKTEQGRAITHLNAVKHGGLAMVPVVPKLEKRDAWQALLDATLDSLQPVGHLETVLAGRVALLLWRLERVARYERATIAVAQETVEDDLAEARRRSFARSHGADRPDELRDALHDAEALGRLLGTFDELPDDAPVSGEDACEILSAVADYTEVVDAEVFSMPEVVPDEVTWDQYPDWTAGRVRKGIVAIATAVETTTDALWWGVLQDRLGKRLRLEQELERVEEQLSRMRRERLLPPGPELDKLTRYEAHLSRQLAQALHELQRLQAGRAGDPITPPAMLDVTVSGSE